MLARKRHRFHSCLRVETLEDRRLLAMVNFAPADFSGPYRVLGEDNFSTGSKSLDLDPGTYSLELTNATPFTFNVDVAGDVASNNAAAASAAGNTLTFNTTEITVDPAAYTGQYQLALGFSFTSGVQDFTVVKGISNYFILVGGTGGFRFDVDGSGNVNQGTGAATGIGSTLAFNTTTINVDPAAYTGQYRPDGIISPSWVSGPQSVVVVPSVSNYRMEIGDNQTDFRYDVDASGNATQNTGAAVGVGNTLVFNTVTIHIDPGDPTPQYSLNNVPISVVTGPQDSS